MVASSKFKVSHLLDPKNAQFSGQDRVNAEIFTAMEILGHKLERSEAEKQRLTKRLADIEASATLDEETEEAPDIPKPPLKLKKKHYDEGHGAVYDDPKPKKELLKL